MNLNMFIHIGTEAAYLFGMVALLFPGVLLSPMIAGAAMSVSSVSVIGNALRLRKVAL